MILKPRCSTCQLTCCKSICVSFFIDAIIMNPLAFLKTERQPLLIRDSPDTGGFAANVALLTGLGNDKSPSPRAKGGRGLRLRHSNTETRLICLFQGILLPLITRRS